MGLDMFAYKMKYNPSKEVDFQEEIQDVETEEVHYWRKHPNLHGWMENLYRSKGGEGEQFNCDPVVLKEDDLHQLAACIIDNELPHTSGFFFGESYDNEEEREDDLKFVKDSLKAIEEGYTVYYDSWW